MVSHSSIQASQGSLSPASGKKNFPWRQCVTVVLVLLLILFLARLALVFFTTDSATATTGVQAMAGSDTEAVDIIQLQSGRFFNTRSAGGNSAVLTRQAEMQTPLTAGETSLNLRLEGVVVGNPASQGFAMIASNGSPGTYHIGDRLRVGNRVVLDSIQADRVILENNGRMETLWLYAAEDVIPAVATTINRSAPGLSGISTEGSYNPIALVNEYREKFQNSALAGDFLTLSEIVNISPEHSNGQLLGYRLSPGEHLKEFVRLGFKTNDIVTRINGIDLNDIGNLPGLFQVMTTASEVTLTVLRDDQSMDLALSLEELPRQN